MQALDTWLGRWKIKQSKKDPSLKYSLAICGVTLTETTIFKNSPKTTVFFPMVIGSDVKTFQHLLIFKMIASISYIEIIPFDTFKEKVPVC